MAFDLQHFNARWEQRLDLVQEVFLLNLSGAQALVAHQFDVARTVLAQNGDAATPRSVWLADPKALTTGALATEEWLRRYKSVIARSMRLVECRTAQAQVLLRELEASLLDATATDSDVPDVEPVARSPRRSGLPDQRLAA
jgi:hypothetical protein